ncbi:heterokaryon incompatibility protein-domain-containing protein [Xylariaceae sp. FL0804]|nr:heterokaryon incompatibility protein-domain-containing protein [Xylariaceae sp. FL0804]
MDCPGMSEDAENCKVCEGLLHTLSGNNVDFEFEIEDVLALACQGHKDFFEQLKDHCISEGIHSRPGRVEGGLIYIGNRLVWALALPCKTSLEAMTANSNWVSQQERARVVNPGWMNIELARIWKHHCLAEHGTKCENAWKMAPARPAWLVDTEKGSLVNGRDRPSRFVALSYRWGHLDKLKTTTSNLSMLEQPHILERTDIRANLPSTVLHAMGLVRELGERYLWVDALCIVQDDHGMKEGQLKIMGALYGTAVLTIVVTDGDADHGIPGIRGISGPRKLSQQVIAFSEENIVIQPTHLPVGMIKPYTDYETRGWTFQEYHLSGRKLIFNGEQMHWTCQCVQWREDTTAVGKPGAIDELHIDTLAAGMPHLGEYSKLVRDFNERHLTYEDDALPAITGMLTLFSRSFEGGFTYGLPDMFFDAALCWRQYGFRTFLERRTPSAKAKPPFDRMPSWSWIGWHGPTDCCFQEENFSIDDYIQTIPTTVWYASTEPHGGQKRRVQTTWFEKRRLLKDHSRPVPPGWSREMRNDYIYRHELAPEEDFRYPVPVSSISPETQPALPQLMPYISCRTHKTFLQACQPAEEATRYQYSRLNMVALLDRSSNEVGKLQLQGEGELARFAAGGSTTTTTPVELVRICRRVHRFEGDLCVVLWVGWDKGVAYRKAIGWVDTDFWDTRAELEELTLILS